MKLSFISLPHEDLCHLLYFQPTKNVDVLPSLARFVPLSSPLLHETMFKKKINIYPLENNTLT